MKKKIIIAGLLLSSSMSVIGQVKVSNLEVTRNGDVAMVTFEAQVAKKVVGRNRKMITTPVLSAGNSQAQLSPIVIESRRTRIMDSRNKVSRIEDAIYTQAGKTLIYTAKIPYSEWMDGSNLIFQKTVEGCCNKYQMPSVSYAHNIRVANESDSSIQPNEPTAVPIRFDGKIFILEKSAPLLSVSVVGSDGSINNTATKLDRIGVDFKVGSSRLDMNPSNIKSLDMMVEMLRASKDVLSGKIDITGYASPEGSQAVNYELAQNRALAVRNYILDNVPYLRPSDFTIINGGENWEGLRQLVEESSMPGRWQVIDIIENVPAAINYITNTSRKQQLMNLNGGNTWRYMQTHFFPQLRNAASVSIYKTIDVNEMDSPMLPSENTDQINRAIDAIGERNSSEALALLMNVSNDPRAWNPIGVCYVMEHNLAKAREYFQKAIDAGYTEAKGNLAQIQ